MISSLPQTDRLQFCDDDNDNNEEYAVVAFI